MKTLRLLAFAAATMSALAFAIPAKAQTPSVPGPYNVDLGAVITNAARVPGTVTTAPQTNLAYNGVVCTFNQTGSSGSPSTTFSIQQYDSATASWTTLVTSGAITSNGAPTPIVVYPGIQTTSLPAGMVALSMKLPRTYRVSQTIAGAGTTSTSKIGCNLLK